MRGIEFDSRIRFDPARSLRNSDEFATGSTRACRAFLDPGSDINLIDQSLVVDLGLKRLKGADLPKPGWLDKQKCYCYGAYDIEWTAIDSWKQRRTAVTRMYAVNISDYDMLLGFPGCHDQHISLHCGSHQWRYDINAGRLQVDNVKAFANTIDQQAETVYALLMANEESKPVVTLPEYLSEYRDVFSKQEADKLPEQRIGGSHAIDVMPGEEPPYGPIYNLSNLELNELRRYLEEAMQKGIIQHSTSPAGAPILFVPKKNGGLRLCVDYRGLNKVTIKNRHPLPLITETLDRLGGAKHFTKFDLIDAYHRIRIRDGDEWKTAFRTRYGHFEYRVMPFGLANAPATFQAYINKALVGLVDLICVVYLDDILIFSNSEAEHRKHVKLVLDRLRKNGFVCESGKVFF